MSHAWFPASPCGPGCLPGREPVVGRARRWWRLTAVVLVVSAAPLTLVLLDIAKVDPRYIKFFLGEQG